MMHLPLAAGWSICVPRPLNMAHWYALAPTALLGLTAVPAAGSDCQRRGREDDLKDESFSSFL